MFFFSFGPWAIFLSTRICFDFSHLLIFFYKKTCFDGFLKTKFNVLLILLKFQCQFPGAALEN